jgi:hypothetical protein
MQLLQAGPRSKLMVAQTHPEQRIFTETQSAFLAIAARPRARESATNMARSEENILRWTSYLPKDCIRAMVLMGWDINT